MAKRVSLRWSLEEIAQEAVIIPSDAAGAVKAWQALAPRKYRDLVKADLQGSAFGFNADRLLYTHAGRAIPTRELSKVVNTVVQNWGEKLQGQTRSMLAGDMPLGDWQQGVADSLKSMHTSLTIVGKGGVQEVTREDSLYLQGELKFQYERLQRFALQVERGELTPAQVEARIKLYANSGNVTYENCRQTAAEDNGMDEERRVLGVAEHCEVCVEESDKGWQPIGTLLDIGDALCKWNCRCHFEYRAKAAAESGKDVVKKDDRSVSVTSDKSLAQAAVDAFSR